MRVESDPHPSRPGAAASRASSQQRWIHSLLAGASEARGYRSALHYVLARLCRSGGWDYAEAWIPTRDSQGIKLGPATLRARAPALRHLRQRGREMGLHLGQDLPGRVFLARTTEWIHDLGARPRSAFRRRDLARAAGLDTAVGLPLLASSRPIAAVVLFARERRGLPEGAMERIHVALAALGPVLEQKRIEMSVRAKARHEEIVARLGLRALEGIEIGTLFDEAAALAAETLGAGRALILELAAESERPRVAASFGWSGAERAGWSAGEPYVRHTLAAAEGLVVANFRTERRFPPPAPFREEGIASAVGVAIPGSARPRGLLCVQTTARRRFPKSTVNLLQGIASVLGMARERERAERELQHHRDRLEELVVERTAELEASHERLREAERLSSIGTLARGITHDMNNVMLPALCRLDALEAAALPEGITDDLRGVRRSLDQLRRLTRGLQLFARSVEEQPGLPASTRLRDWWEEVGSLMAKVLPAEVEFDASFPADLPPVRVAPDQLTQAVLSLVTNAGDALEGPGSVRLRAEPAGKGRFLRLSVTDDGRGMSADVRRQAVEPLFTTKTRSLSTGLGLSLVRALASSAGGFLEIASQPGAGTTVLLHLPVADAPERAPADGEALHRGAEIVLANRRTAAFVTSLLESSGFALDAAGACESLLAVWEGARVSRRDLLAYLARHPARRILLVGAPRDPVSERRVSIVAEASNLEAVRRALASIVQDLLELTDDAF